MYEFDVDRTLFMFMPKNINSEIFYYHANLQPAIGCHEEEGGNIICICVFKQFLLEPLLMPDIKK